MTFDFGAIGTAADLLAITRVMEERSADRFRELAEAFDESCNRDTADAFRELAAVEDRHAAEFPASGGVVPKVLPWGDIDPEIADPGAVHYLMHPWHAFDLALRNQEKALGFFETISTQTSFPEVRAEASRLAERERGHIAFIKTRLAELPVPPDDWEDDPDPPNWDM